MNRTGLGPYLKDANKEIIVSIQVETKACMDNLEEVLSVPGIDMVFVGPIDLCFSLGLHEKYGVAEMFDSPELKVTPHSGSAQKRGMPLPITMSVHASSVHWYFSNGLPVPRCKPQLYYLSSRK